MSKTLRSLDVLVKRAFHVSKPGFLGQPSHLTHPHIIADDEVTPRITVSEYRGRRNRLAELVRKHDYSKKHVIIIPSLDRSYMAAGVPFIYRQNSYMRYLSGFLENESALVLEVDKSGYSSVLFVKEHSQHENLWEGYRSGAAGALKLTGVDRTDDIRNMQPHLMNSILHDDVMLWYNKGNPISPTLHERYFKPIADRVKPSNIRTIESEVDSLRIHKSPAEADLLRMCGNITAEMFMESMPFTVDHPDEHLLFAKFDYEGRIRGANNLAYLPVVAGGVNALTIHYIKNDSPIKSGDLVLVDCGCDFHGYVSDVTRTWPVNGEFSDVQRQLYEAVQEVHNICLRFCKPREYSLDDVFSVMMAMLAKQLVRLGAVNKSISDKDLAKLAYDICPHHVGHWVGMDVHDTPSISRSRKFEPNMVAAIEPGMYFGVNDDRIVKEFRGLGIRIEDNILITDDGFENLTDSLPTSSEEVENIVKYNSDHE